MFEWAAMTKQRWLPVEAKSNVEACFEPMNTDICCDVCIIILCVQSICIIYVLLYAMKYVNVVLSKYVDLV